MRTVLVPGLLLLEKKSLFRLGRFMRVREWPLDQALTLLYQELSLLYQELTLFYHAVWNRWLSQS